MFQVVETVAVSTIFIVSSVQAGDVCVMCTTGLLGSVRISEGDPRLEPRDDVVMHKGVRCFKI